MSPHNPPVRIAVTMGDPAGIGPELCAKVLAKSPSKAQCVVVGDSWVLEKVTKTHRHKDTRFEIVDLKNVDRQHFSFGRVRAEYGRASMEYLDRAMAMVREGEVDGIVTCPISKEAISLAGFQYSGHTEYFRAKAKAEDVVMLLVNQDLKVGLVTRHIPLSEVPQSLDAHKISRTLMFTYQALREFFGIARPRLVVCGINPHGSDGGVIGDEEQRLIEPAVRALRKKIDCLDGPIGADVAIAKAVHKQYDAVIAMYHDQALIPLKCLGDETGVNMTLGLDFVRTSPLHGTAFDIAGKNKADPSSLLAAIKLCAECCQNRKKA